VVLYTSVDQVFSEPVLQEFTRKTGIKVQALYDAEATKTTGLVNRLLAEKTNPRADVFWNGEFVQTILLKEQGILVPYDSPEAKSLPANFRDADAQWTAFGGRARILIVNTSLLQPEEYPSTIQDLLNEKYPASQIGIACPVFGTAATQAAALYAAWEPDQALEFFEALQARGIQVLDGNSVTRDMVADGRLAFAYTDTDDALSAIQAGKPVTAVFPDQEEGGLGTLIIPNTVAMIRGCPHQEQAERLIDFLLSESTERELVAAGWIDIPSHPTVNGGYYSRFQKIRGMDLDFNQVYQNLERSKKEMQVLFIR
jgi:iron(III) transport system substrate-binding protein